MKYVVTLSKSNLRRKWWENNCIPDSLEKESFDSFEEAKKYFRELIVSERSKKIKITNGWYNKLKRFASDCELTPDMDEDGYNVTWNDVSTVNGILTSIITDPNYFYSGKKLSVKSVEDSDWSWAFIANNDIVVLSLDQSELNFGTNAHIMNDEIKDYFFYYEFIDHDSGDLLESKTIRLIAVD